jgi:site-specific recombinase XerD
MPVDQAGAVTYEVAVSKWLSWLEHVAGRSRATIKNYAHHAKSFGRWMAGAGIDYRELTLTDVEQFIADQVTGGLSKASARTYLNGLKEAFARFKKVGAIKENVFADVVRPKITQKLPEWLSAEELSRVISVCSDWREKCVVALAYGGGLRAAEMLHLGISDVRPAQGSVRILGKGGREAWQPLPPWAFELLSSRPADVGERFLPMCYDTLYRITVRISKRSGIKVRPHKLRHSYATSLLNRNVDLRRLQDLMRHKRLDTTAIYLHITNDQLRQAADMLPDPSDPL